MPRPDNLRRPRRRPQGPVDHMGVLVPWANVMVETELPDWTDRQVVWHYARLAPPNKETALTGDFLTGLIEATPGGLHQLSRLPLQRIYLACTSASFTQQNAVKQATASAPVEVITAFDALLAALDQFGARSIALATPYPEQVTAIEVEAFSAAGITVTGSASLDLDDGYADLAPAQITDLVHGLIDGSVDRADAVVLSCTAWPTRIALQQLRRTLGRPLISSNLAICMHATRKAP
ncbi:aspartate/glutamate racemase family protein [Actinomadura sp. 7K507]|uniref:maleate cis-trans isomerase family protein n=1 Tax=Actinomadura sp. 7K507 TaxID=2530365 RepID=UPI001053D396|nr:aspartate/glutamate racemase family protein [Actinomadura sp. 7K507]TDC91965.1 hypothetical protein E1285_12350 [Actinomadura sp. 7K507]